MPAVILDGQIITANDPYCDETQNVNVRIGETINFQIFNSVPESPTNLVDEPNFDAQGNWVLNGVTIASGRACVEEEYNECTGYQNIEETSNGTISFANFVAPSTNNYTFRFDLSQYNIQTGSLDLERQIGVNPVAILVSYAEGESGTSDFYEDTMNLTMGDTVTFQLAYSTDASPGDAEMTFNDACIVITAQAPTLRQNIDAVDGILPDTNYYLTFDKYGTGNCSTLFYNAIGGDEFVDDTVDYQSQPEYYFRTDEEVDYRLLFELSGDACIDNVRLYEIPGYELEMYDCDGNEIIISDKLTTYIAGRVTQYALDTTSLDAGCYRFVLVGDDEITTNYFCLCPESECETRLKISWSNSNNIYFQDGSFIDNYNLDNTQTVYVDGTISRPYPGLDVSGYNDCLNGFYPNISSIDFSYNVTLIKMPLHLALAVATGNINEEFYINDIRYQITDSQELEPNEETNLYIFSFVIKKYQFGLTNN